MSWDGHHNFKIDVLKIKFVFYSNLITLQITIFTAVIIVLTFLLQCLMKHFKTIPVNEKEILSYFFYMIKCNTNKLDQKNGSSEHGSER